MSNLKKSWNGQKFSLMEILEKSWEIYLHMHNGKFQEFGEGFFMMEVSDMWYKTRHTKNKLYHRGEVQKILNFGRHHILISPKYRKSDNKKNRKTCYSQSKEKKTLKKIFS